MKDPSIQAAERLTKLAASRARSSSASRVYIFLVTVRPSPALGRAASSPPARLRCFRSPFQLGDARLNVLQLDSFEGAIKDTLSSPEPDRRRYVHVGH